MSDHEGAHQQAGESSQGDHSRPQVPDSCVRVLNLDEVLDHSPPVHFSLYRFHRLTGVKAGIRVGGSDDEALAEYGVSGTRREDAVPEAPAD